MRSSSWHERLVSLRERARTSFDALQIVSATVGLLVLFLRQVPWLEGTFKAIGLTDSDAVRTSILVLVLASLFGELQAISVRLTPTNPGERRYFASPVALYPFLASLEPQVTRPEERRIDILGYTLIEAWPLLSNWLRLSGTENWTIRIAALYDRHDAYRDVLPANWYLDARFNVDSAREFSKSTDLTRRNITLEVYDYSFLPAVVGIKIGTGALFLSLMLWDDNGSVKDPGLDFEYIPTEDHTPNAEAMRTLFGSWFAAAARPSA